MGVFNAPQHELRIVVSTYRNRRDQGNCVCATPHRRHTIRAMYIRATVGLALLVATTPFVCEAQSTTSLSLLQKAIALTPNLQSGEHLYIQYCASCHQRSGWGSGPREVPALAGQQDVYLLEQLINFSTQDRRKAEMHDVVTKPELDNPQAIRDVSSYIAARPHNPKSDRGDGTQLALGERLFTQSCVICHDKGGEGNRNDLIPAIGGQQYGYLLVRLRHFKQEHGSQEWQSLQPAVVNLLERLSPDETKAVADYTSRLPALQRH
jgi:cytochrome c553